MTWRIDFPTGKPIEAATADEALEVWRQQQWRDLGTALFREELVKRAYILSGQIIESWLPTEQLLAELDKAGVIRLTVAPTGRSK